MPAKHKALPSRIKKQSYKLVINRSLYYTILLYPFLKNGGAQDAKKMAGFYLLATPSSRYDTL